MDNDWALVVGINTYSKATGVEELKGAAYDATQFHEWVVGSGVPEHQANLLISPDPPDPKGQPRPALWHIQKFFDELIDTLNNNVGGRLYIYLSGHGISPTGQDSMRNAALLMANAQSPNRLYNLPGNVWAEAARSAALFREVVLFMDCCLDLKNNANVPSHPFGDPTLDSQDCRLLMAYATRWNSKARELPLPPDDRTRGVFTHSLLEVLRSGRVDGKLLKESVRAHLKRTLKDEKKAQVPQFGPEDELAAIVFNKAAAPPSTEVRIAGSDHERPAVEFFPEGAAMGERVPLDGWNYKDGFWHGTLAPGMYTIQQPAGGSGRLNVLAAVPASFPEEG